MQRTPFGRRCILYVRRLNMSSLVEPLVGKFLHALEKKDYSWFLRFGDVTSGPNLLLTRRQKLHGLTMRCS